MKIVDEIEVKVIDKNGNVKAEIKDSGKSITYAGLREIAKLIGSGLGGTSFGYIAIGTGGTTAFDPNQTALVNEVKRKVASISLGTTNISNDTTIFQATFSSADGLTGTQTINEAGIFNASTGGVMLDRFDSSSINVTANWDAGDQLQVTIKIVTSTV